MRQGQQHKYHSDVYSADTKYSQERYNAEGYRTANILLFLRTMKRKEEVTKQVLAPSVLPSIRCVVQWINKQFYENLC